MNAEMAGALNGMARPHISHIVHDLRGLNQQNALLSAELFPLYAIVALVSEQAGARQDCRRARSD